MRLCRISFVALGVLLFSFFFSWSSSEFLLLSSGVAVALFSLLYLVVVDVAALWGSLRFVPNIDIGAGRSQRHSTESPLWRAQMAQKVVSSGS